MAKRSVGGIPLPSARFWIMAGIVTLAFIWGVNNIPFLNRITAKRGA